MATPHFFTVRRAIVAALVFLMAAAQALATWSIIIVDTATGEVAIGQATCLANFNLQTASAVVFVGKGAGCAQSFVDTTGANRVAMFNGFNNSVGLQQILNQLIAQDPSFQFRQYGMVSLYDNGSALTFTGTNCGAFAGGVTGQIGTLKFAIQGNVLTGLPVITSAEQAVLTTPGDVGRKLMAAMRAAQLKGGDGRCSCSPSNPTGCGSPPPSFTKSCHTAYMLIARIGDTNGTCNQPQGCANGQYYMNLNVIGGTGGPDPVTTLNSQFNTFRTGWAGHADHILSKVQWDVPGLPADGVSQAVMTITLKDINNNPVPGAGAAITVSHDASSAATCTIGAVTPQGNGVYTVPVTAGTAKGNNVFRVVVNDGKGHVLLYPFPRLSVSPLCQGYGNATPGTGGQNPSIACGGPSVIGNAQFGFAVQQVAPNAAVVIYAAQNPASIPFGSTGTLLFDPATIAFESTLVVADAGGQALIGAALPNDPALSGLHAYVQALALDPGAEIGVSATAGLDVELF